MGDIQLSNHFDKGIPRGVLGEHIVFSEQNPQAVFSVTNQIGDIILIVENRNRRIGRLSQQKTVRNSTAVQIVGGLPVTDGRKNDTGGIGFVNRNISGQIRRRRIVTVFRKAPNFPRLAGNPFGVLEHTGSLQKI